MSIPLSMLAYRGERRPPLGSAHDYVPAGLELSRGMFDSCTSVLFRSGRIASEKRDQSPSLSYEVSGLEGASQPLPHDGPQAAPKLPPSGLPWIDVSAPFIFDMFIPCELPQLIPSGGVVCQPLVPPAFHLLGYLVPGHVGKLSIGQPITASGAYLDSGFAQDVEEIFESTLGQYSERQSPTFLELEFEVKSYLTLGPNWDMEGAAEVEGAIVDKALGLLTSASKLQNGSHELWPLASPMPDGQISFAWENGSKELWVSIGQAGFTSHRWGDKQQFRGDVSNWKHPDEIREHLEWLKT